jgi:hypothetical protein
MICQVSAQFDAAPLTGRFSHGAQEQGQRYFTSDICYRTLQSVTDALLRVGSLLSHVDKDAML